MLLPRGNIIPLFFKFFISTSEFPKQEECEIKPAVYKSGNFCLFIYIWAQVNSLSKNW